MKEIVTENTFILPLQNGVNKRTRLEKVLEKGIILDGCVYMAVHIESPGVVKQAGSLRKLLFGRDTGDITLLKPLEELMLGAGIEVRLVSDIDLPVWTKYLLICSLSAATSYFQKTVGEILSSAVEKDFMEGLIREAELVARKKGIHFPEDIFETTMNTIKSFPYDTKTSMQRDLEQGRKSELEYFSGEIVRIGMSIGIDTPLHSIAYESIKSKI